MTFHISKNGKAYACKAQPGNCPLGGPSGDENHFATQEEAEAYINRDQMVVPAAASRREPTVVVHPLAPAFPIEDLTPLDSFRLQEDAILESKNKGEFSEIYAAHKLLTPEGFRTMPGTPPLNVHSMELGGAAYIKGDEDKVYAQNSKGERAVFYADPTSGERLFGAIKEGRGRSFASPVIQSSAVAMGFTDGRVPKGKANEKADVVVYDTAGQRRNISIKSHIGAAPGIINPSKSSYVHYEVPLPEGMSEADAQALVEALSEHKKSAAHRVAALKEAGITFDPTQGQFATTPGLSDNLKTVDEKAEAAYAAKVFTVADRSYKLPEELEVPYHKTIGAFARRLNHSSGFVPEEETVTDMLIVDKTGQAHVHAARTDEEAGRTIHRKISVGEHLERFESLLSVRDGKMRLSLNAAFSVAA